MLATRGVLSVTVSVALVVSAAAFAKGSAQGIAPEQYQELPYRFIGPEGSRVTSVVGVPGDPKVYYAGGASGGIFKSTDGGTHWEPIFDDQPVSSIGSLAVAPSDPNIVWAGTGESFIRSNVSLGNGIYKSTDGGETWQHMGLEATGRIGRVIIHPTDPDIVFAAAQGHSYGPQPERGVFRTKDGGDSWERVLFVDENAGASDIAMDPNNPRILFAGIWQLEIHTWGRTSGGSSSGLWVSRDGGDTWVELTRPVEDGGAPGLPHKPLGKIAVAVGPSDSSRIYALIETGDGVPWEHGETDTGELWRSDDGGDAWMLVSYNRNLAGRTAYYSRVVVSPDDADEAYFVAGAFSKTSDGGETATNMTYVGERPLGDNHDTWIDPTDGDRMIVGNDGGLAITVNRGRTWRRVHLPNAQMYHVAVDNRIPYYVYGNRQDGPSVRGPSNSRLQPAPGMAFHGIPKSMWHSVGGGESGFAVPDPVDPDIIWATASGSGAVGGIVERFNERTRQFRRVEVWPEVTRGRPAAELVYRFNWTFPIVISPHDHNTVYVSSQHVHRTTDGGNSWQVISPDLSTNDKSKQQISGGLTPDNIGVEYCCVVFAIDESPLQEGVLWAGSNDGLVQVTRDGGQSWTNVTENIPGLPPWGTVSNIDASRYEAGKAYITVDFHQVNDRRPYVYKTDDYGRTWTKIVSGIPESPLSYAHCVREDPVRPGLLYVGTENALYVSFDDGASWQSLQNNLPHAPVHWIEVQEHFNDLVVSTYGRGFWILDDITPLQQLNDPVRGAAAHLFEPRAAYRLRPITRPTSASYFAAYDPTAGENPPNGASINYWLGAEPDGEVTVEILSHTGEVIRTLEGTRNVGINRIWWDLQNEPSSEIRLRTKPLYAPEVGLGPDRWRPFPGGGRISVLMPPGIYTVRLTAAGRELTRQLEVRKDPITEGTEADIAAQTDLLFEIRDDLDVVAGMINEIEWIRRQLYDLTDVLEGDDRAADIRAAATDLDKDLMEVEQQLYQLKLTGRGDGIRWPAQLAAKLTYLAGSVAQADFPPTTQALAVHDQLGEQTGTLRSELDEALRDNIAAFNRMLRERDLGKIIADVR